MKFKDSKFKINSNYSPKSIKKFKISLINNSKNLIRLNKKKEKKLKNIKSQKMI